LAAARACHKIQKKLRERAAHMMEKEEIGMKEGKTAPYSQLQASS
jgi:hypothetical protein